ncbi:MAG: ImmA/IrrE family metallo-endopeptidase [Chloroflexi bacterium]|nr:ImmA/IrrE family metallo-endopeptidase [Chloroflexota bacterium]
MTEHWLAEICEDFWKAAGGAEPFPRDLEKPMLWALPLAVVKLPRLWVRDVETWLERRGISFRLGFADRPLHGCLVALGSNGCVLLDGTDPVEERRFSLAHEASHFLLDYLQPRKRAVDKLGEHILEVFDGMRPPTIEERVDSLLGNAAIGVHTHLMERASGGIFGCSRVLGAENRADRLALELLAPANEVRARLEAAGMPERIQQARLLLLNLLMIDFGLPRSIADHYSKWLCAEWYGGPSFREWLGVV